MDNPNVRRGSTCPLCYGFKDKGLITCPQCYCGYGLKYGNPRAEAIIAVAEQALIAVPEER
jgi:hypothetical protein